MITIDLYDISCVLDCLPRSSNGTELAQGRPIETDSFSTKCSIYLPRYELKSLKYLLQSDEDSSGLSGGSFETLYFLSSTGEKDTVLGDAERVRTDVIPYEWGYKRRRCLIPNAVELRLRLDED